MDTLETQQSSTEQQTGSEVQQTVPETPAVEAQVPADDLIDEAKLAAEALAATDTGPAGDTPEIAGMKKESERLLGEITARRQLNRELDKKLADKLAAEEAAKPPELSPEEKYIKENSDTFDPETEPFPANVQMAQRKFDKEQAAKAAQKQEASLVSSKANAVYLKAREKFSDFDDIIMISQDLLTEGDQVDIKAAIKRGEDGAEALYKRCIYKTLLAGGDRAKEMRAKLQKKVVAKASVQTQTQTNQKPGGSETQTTNVPVNPPASAEEAINNPVLAHIYGAMGYEEG